MSLKQPPKTRREYILDKRPTKSIQAIADDMGVNRRTIDRDISKLKEKGLYQSVYENEFWRLHREGEVSDETKYREVAKLVGKNIVEKHELETKGDLTVNVVFSKLMEDGSKDTVRAT